MANKKTEKRVELITDYTSLASEEIQKLQTAIDFASVNQKIKVIAVTSSEQSEGKSTLLGNLANLYAFKGAKVVLLNLDLRRPSIHHLYHVPNKVGVVEYVTGEATLEKVLVHLPNGVDLINSGTKTPFPVKILQAPKLAELIQKLKAEYDYVLVDTTPALVVTDAMLVSKLVDGMIFVVAQHESKKKQVAACIKSLQEQDANIIGIAITKATELGGSDGSYGSYYYYYYEDSETGEHKHKHKHK